MNYVFALAISNPLSGENSDTAQNSLNKIKEHQKIIFTCAIILNLMPLLWFKYSGFIIQNLALLLHADWRFTPPEMPLGISFYTFIQIAWLTSIYRQQIQPDGFMRHAVFSSFFAYIISGPIVRYEQMGWQLDKLTATSAVELAKGFTLFSIGLAKKVILADSIGFYANAVFNAAEKSWPISGLEAWMGSLCYTFQLYFDFSGYTDMALGLGLMIGLRLPENFDSPYKSTGIVEFWRRWHMTLSSWLRDFLYIPLGGNRKGKLRQYLNLFLTMLIGGVWHGAGWTYIVWGSLHGIMLGINHFFRSQIKDTACEKWLKILPGRIFFIIFTFMCLNFCWVVFRAVSLDGALAIYKAMLTGPFLELKQPINGEAAAIADIFRLSFSFEWHELLPNNYFTGWQPFVLVGGCAALCWFFPNSRQILYGYQNHSKNLFCWRPTRNWAIACALLVFISLTMITRNSAFLYFQF